MRTTRCVAGVLAALVVPAALPIERASAGPTPEFRLIARPGDPFPDRPGYVYNTTLASPFMGARSNDPNGDIYFQAHASGPDGDLDDILVYRRATHTVEPYAKSGEEIDGAPVRLFWGTVGGAQAGTMAHIARLQDGTPGDRAVVLVSGPDGSRFIAARQGDVAPGQAAPFTEVGLASGEFLDVNMNSVGAVSYGGRFKDADNKLQYGYYRTQPGGLPERIVDSTMPVPGRPGAVWINSDQINAPFDIYTPGLDVAGNAFFRAKYRDGGNNFRAFYRGDVDGTITAIADAGSSDPVPGVPAGSTYARFRTAANNQGGDVAFGAEINNADGSPYGSGVFSVLAGESVTKVLVTGDEIPGIPEAQNARFGLSSMNDAGHLLITANYFLSGLGGQSLVLSNPDGTIEPVLKFDQTPGYPGERAGLTLAADLNAAGDAVFITHMNMSPSNEAAFAYLNDTDTLVPILKTGDVLGGLTVVTMSLGGGADDPMGSIGASGGPVAWDDARNLSLVVTLKDADGVQSTSLYAVQVPTPGGLVVLGLGGLACARGRR